MDLLICWSASDGATTAQLNILAAATKCLRLKVTIATAPPFTAASKTMSSSGSCNCGRQRNASWTGTADAATSSSTCSTSHLCKPLAFRCSGRVKTASYSNINGTERSRSNRRYKAASSSCREAPRSLRTAATITSVSRTNARFTLYDDIAGNITTATGKWQDICDLSHSRL